MKFSVEISDLAASEVYLGGAKANNAHSRYN